MFVYWQEEKRAALHDLEATQLKELAHKRGLGFGAAALQTSKQVHFFTLHRVSKKRPTYGLL